MARKKQYRPEPEVRKCDRCKKTKLCFYGVDPYDWEIHHEDTEYWMCDDCLDARSMDI